jgi:uncharacterized membrane protein YqjE
MFEKVREAKALLHFIKARMPQYGPLVAQDAKEFRNEIVKATVGAGISGVAGLIFSCFLSVAIIITAWSGPHRVQVAWAVCGVWGVLALIGLVFALRAISGPTPFRLVSHALAADYANLIIVIEQEMGAHT